ncbi:hypothetical protein MCOR27_000630 [Pyricularia oryzae]|uniref:GST N-terminal domain-containing protein n=2 Tax=Pyricularia TaxID=48558 RepID=A0ABQ8NPQ9_PYRGI|nr:hypothetical protein MCOR01_005640 [Pyricularia oryzae]KAI6300188.1 hypothetical protein MCOR33_004082 [Pyricularia grisea]KAH9434847.1 hypothetical protein MCOR02_003812 [Pyricularia oryzae]KAI6255711.1 hypothetical protein MCOR19_007812 [Pyricularia oryzae]KAI6270535.1 hypothetical protein MCOR26_008200 [Pyricularia oryzae]
MTNVDTSILDHATGRAAELAKAHSAEQPLKLYAGWFCPFVQRSWIVLEEKRIPYQYIEINPYHKSPDFLALNPRGLVPTLAVPHATTSTGDKQQTKPLYESTIIDEYLDEAYADQSAHGPPLLPADPYQRARCRIWIEHCGKIVAGFYKVLQHTPGKSTYGAEEAREAFCGPIKTLVEHMAVDGGPWFLGAEFSLVDVTLAPFARRLWLLDHYKPNWGGMPDGDDEGDKRIAQRWKVWVDACLARESVVATSSDDAAYIDVYRRYAEDRTNSKVAQATRTGDKLP